MAAYSTMDFGDVINHIFGHFINPQKRIFFGYFCLSFFIGFIWLFVLKKKSVRTSLAIIFSRNVWMGRSAKVDYTIFILNRILTLFISPLLITQLAIATAVYFWLHGVSWLQVGAFAQWPKPVIIALYTIIIFVIDDFSKFLVHMMMHKLPFLWSIHQTHHSAETLTPITVYRVHPLEGILYALRGSVAQGTTLALVFFLFGSSVSLASVLGINVIVFVFHIAGSNLRHSHIRIRYWRWLETLLISPAQHQLHHSIAVEHYNKNFGVALAIWDWLFGSLIYSKADDAVLEFGLLEKGVKSNHSAWILYCKPFVHLYGCACSLLMMSKYQIVKFFKYALKI